MEDASGETNMSAYLAVGAWHHWLVRGDAELVEELWPAVRRGLDFAVAMQLPFGGVAWSQEWHDGRPATVNREALLAGSSSIYHALRAGVALSELLDDPQPEWELAGGRLGHALREHRDLFLDKGTFSMDWYYPVLGGAVRGDAGRAVLDGRWDDFVVPGLGVRCVSTNPWVTGAESAELVLALDALGDRERALRVLADIAAPALARRLLLDRLRLPRGGQLARRAHDVHRRGGAARGRRPHPHDHRVRHHARQHAAVVRGDRSRLRVPRLSARRRPRLLTPGGAPGASRGPRPPRSHRSRSRAARAWYGAWPPSSGRSNTSWTASDPPATSQRAHPV